VGKNIPSSRDEEIQVHLVETDGIDEVIIMNIDNKSPGGESGKVGVSKRSYYGSGK
jgi:hypothetical protein